MKNLGINGGGQMKKYSLALLILVVFFITPTKSNAQVNWDGAEIVKGQTGKMTFSKDVKVYKKNSNGTYSSMTVKRNNFFRVYNIEKYDQKTFYWMSSGYRVQATDLVIFKEVPTEIRSSFYNNPAYIVSNHQGTKAYFEEKYPMIDLAYGQHLLSEQIPGNYSSEVYFDKGKLNYVYSLEEGNIVSGAVNGTDIRIIETTTRDKGYYAVTTDTKLLMGPMNGARAIEWNPPSTLNDLYSLKKMFTYPTGSAFQSLGIEVNGYLQVQSMTGERGYMPAKLLKPVNNQGKRYIRYGVIAKGIDHSQQVELKRFDEVSFYTENEYSALIAVNGKMYTVPKNVLAIKMPNESPVITSFLPNERLQKLEYQNIAGNRVYKRNANNHFESGDYYITYHETDQAFNFEMDGVKYSFTKPLKEGAIITRLSGTAQDQGYVRAIHYSLTTQAGTFENIVETSFGQFFAPGYGLLANINDRLISF